MAAQRVLRTIPVDVRLPVRQADSIIEVIGLLGARRREFRAAVGQRLERLDARADTSEMRHTAIEVRLVDVEDSVRRLSLRTRGRRDGPPGERVAVLEHQLELLRSSPNGRHAARQPDSPGTPSSVEPTSSERLGAALMFVGCLVILWVALWRIGLALGLT